MNFPSCRLKIRTIVTKKFYTDVLNLMFADVVLPHSHVMSKIIGYTHDFCNKKLKEVQTPILVPAHNLLSFDFFFVVKGIRLCVWLCVWRTKKLNIRGSSLTDVQYANIGNQVKLLETIKYYQQSLASLAASANEIEKANIRKNERSLYKEDEKILSFSICFLTRKKIGC